MEQRNDQLDPKVEMRFAVVMYGGVSLAIYINGVAQELFRLVASTAPGAESGLLQGTAEVYRDLAEELEARFVVDILSGTSAGGINAVFLAKALANGQSIEGLEKLWVQEADIELLINDRDSVNDTAKAGKKSDLSSPASLLNGYRMYEKLLDAFEEMGEDGPALVDVLDLFVTTTDLQGLIVPIRLAEGVVYERQHRHVFHFRKCEDPPLGDGRNDFKSENNPFLAFSARCTSSFPFAFEPVRLKDVVSENSRWDDFFHPYVHGREDGSEDAYQARAFADGGYLDNKPFSYAIESIAARHADVAVDRKLIYIEPSPELLEQDENVQQPPDALTNVLKAFTLSRYETIQQDLAAVRARNRLIERVHRILRGTDQDINDLNERQQPVNVSEFRADDLRGMIDAAGVGYAGYLRLRVARLTDDLAELITRQAGFDVESDFFLAVRHLVRVWRDDRYAYYDCYGGEGDPPAGQKQCFNCFILDFDLGFHIRRLGFVVSKIDRLLALDQEGRDMLRARGVDERVAEEAGFRKDLRQLREIFSNRRKNLLQLRAERLIPSPESKLTEAVLKIGLDRRVLIQQILDQPTDADQLDEAAKIVRGHADAMEELSREVKTHTDAAHEIIRRCKESLGLIVNGEETLWRDEMPPDPAGKARWIVAFHFKYFSHYDTVSYPLLQAADLGGEIAPVEVIRVSPEDPSSLGGTRIGHFGAFFDRTWRKNDILHGRLDGATKIITSLLPGKKNEALRAKYIERAHQAIMKEMMANPSERLDLFGEVLLGSTSDDREKVGRLLDRLGTRGDGRRSEDGPLTVFKRLLEGNIPASDLNQRFRAYRIRHNLDSELVIRSLTRSTRVAGKMFTRIADEFREKRGKRAAAVMASVGSIGTTLLDASLPGTWRYVIFRRWLQLLMIFAIVMLVASMFLHVEGLPRLGAALLGAAALVQVLGIFLRRAVRTKRLKPLLDGLLVLFIAALVVLLVIGVWYAPDAIQAILDGEAAAGG